MSRPTVWLWVFVLWWLVLTGCTISSTSLWSSTESRFADGALQMLRDGDFIVPHTAQQTSPGKADVIRFYPPLQYWVSALSIHLFGEASERSVRFPTVLAALALLLVLYAFACTFWEPALALLTAFILGTSLEFFEFATKAQPDQLLTLCITLSLFSFYRMYESHHYPLGWKMLFWLGIWVGTLTKGLPSLCLPFYIILLFVICDSRNFRDAVQKIWDLRKLGPVTGILLSSVSVWWYVLAWKHTHGYLVRYILWQENFGSYFDPYVHDESFWFYLTKGLPNALPWSLLLIPLFIHFKSFWQGLEGISGREKRLFRFAFVWFWGLFLFFTLAESKRSYYLMSAFPALALLAVLVLVFWWRRRKKEGAPWSRANTIKMAFVGVALSGGLYFYAGPWQSRRDQEGWAYQRFFSTLRTQIEHDAKPDLCTLNLYRSGMGFTLGRDVILYPSLKRFMSEFEKDRTRCSFLLLSQESYQSILDSAQEPLAQQLLQHSQISGTWNNRQFKHRWHWDLVLLKLFPSHNGDR